MIEFCKDVVSIQGKTFDMEEELLRPYSHVAKERSHKLISQQMSDVLQYWLKVPETKLEAIKCFMEIYVNYTLLSDDIQDHSLQRRTVPAAHCVFGVPLTVNTSYHVLGLCMGKILELGHPQAIDIFAKQHVILSRGQGEDIFMRDNLLCPTEEHFKRIAERKSSEMFRLAYMLLQLFSDNTKDLNKLLTLFGIYYYIRDDYCNIMKQESLEGQQRISELECLNEDNFCEDMTDGKYTWPVIHALQHSEAQPLKYILRQHSRDMVMKRFYRSTLERLGSLEYTRATLDQYDSEMRKEVARLGGNPVMIDLLDDLKDWNN